METLPKFEDLQTIINKHSSDAYNSTSNYVRDQFLLYLANGLEYFVIDLRNTKDLVVNKVITELSQKYPRVYDCEEHTYSTREESRFFAKVFDKDRNVMDFPNKKLCSMRSYGEDANVKQLFTFSKHYVDDKCVHSNIRHHNVYLIPITKNFIDKIEKDGVRTVNFYYAEW